MILRQNQIESHLENMQLNISIVLLTLLGVSFFAATADQQFINDVIKPKKIQRTRKLATTTRSLVESGKGGSGKGGSGNGGSGKGGSGKGVDSGKGNSGKGRAGKGVDSGKGGGSTEDDDICCGYEEVCERVEGKDGERAYEICDWACVGTYWILIIIIIILILIMQNTMMFVVCIWV